MLAWICATKVIGNQASILWHAVCGTIPIVRACDEMLLAAKVGVVLASLIVAHAGIAEAQRSPETAQKKIYAQRHFEQGLSHFDAKNFDEALAAFRASLELYASPNTRLYVARSLKELGRNAEAANAYEETIRSAHLLESEEPRYRDTSRAAKEELDPLRNSLAQVQLRKASGAAVAYVKLQNESIRPESFGLPTYVNPGEVELVVHYEDGRKKTIQQRAERDKIREIILPALDPIKAADDDGPDTTPETPDPAAPLPAEEEGSGALVGFSLSTGVAVIGAAGAVTFGLLGEAKFSELEQECGGPCATDRSSDIDAGKTYDTLANVSLVVGAVGVVSAAVFLAMMLSDDAGETPSERAMTLTPTGVRVRW